MAEAINRGDSARDNIVTFQPRFRPFRADVPAFDPCNQAHLRAWESMFDLGRMEMEARRGKGR